MECPRSEGSEESLAVRFPLHPNYKFVNNTITALRAHTMDKNTSFVCGRDLRQTSAAYDTLKSTGTRDELSITLYLQSEINFYSVRVPVNA